MRSPRSSISRWRARRRTAAVAHRGHRRGALPARIRAAIYEDLAWLGIVWEQPVRRQSEHFDDYRAALAKLDAPGSSIRASRAAARSRGWSPSRRGTAPGRAIPTARRSIPARPARSRRPSAAGASTAGEPYALRLDMAAALRARGRAGLDRDRRGSGRRDRTVAAAPAAWGDVVLARKETPTSYHLAVVVDDALQGVTHVVRGQDLFWSTSVHRLLQALLGLPAPALPPSPADPRRRRPKALEIDARDRLAVRCETAAPACRHPQMLGYSVFRRSGPVRQRAFRLSGPVSRRKARRLRVGARSDAKPGPLATRS